jgi:hypothetical protein
VQRRDAEVTRLSSCLVAGPDVDRLELERRADANNGIILTLTQQVGKAAACSVCWLLKVCLVLQH